MCKGFICMRMVNSFYTSHSTTVNALIMGLLGRNTWEFYQRQLKMSAY